MSLIQTPPKRTRPDFSLTIINIVFLLLLFYLATGSLIRPQEIEAEVPFTKDIPLERLPRPLLLAAADGRLFLDGVPVRLSELGSVVRTQVPSGAPLNVLAERSMTADAMLKILAKIQAAGVATQLVTLREPPAVPGEAP